VRKTQRAQKIRVLLANMSPMLSDIIKSIIASEENFILVGQVSIPDEVSIRDELVRVAVGRRTDVIIVGPLPAAETRDYREFLYRRPRMRIIAIAVGGRHALVHELQPRIIPLDEVSPASLIAAIRGTSGAAGGAIVA
jgi:hypothetical protein